MKKKDLKQRSGKLDERISDLKRSCTRSRRIGSTCLELDGVDIKAADGHGLRLGDVCVRDDGEGEEAFASNHKFKRRVV